jgi:hypothetical protein
VPAPAQPGSQQDTDPAGFASVATALRAPTTGRQTLDRPQPGLPRLAGICGTAAALGLIGLVVGIRGLVILLGNPPAWFEPTFFAVGLLGVGLTVGAFLAVHRALLPWVLLGASGLSVLATMMVTTAV